MSETGETKPIPAGPREPVAAPTTKIALLLHGIVSSQSVSVFVLCLGIVALVAVLAYFKAGSELLTLAVLGAIFLLNRVVQLHHERAALPGGEAKQNLPSIQFHRGEHSATISNVDLGESDMKELIAALILQKRRIPPAKGKVLGSPSDSGSIVAIDPTEAEREAEEAYRSFRLTASDVESRLDEATMGDPQDEDEGVLVKARNTPKSIEVKKTEP